ncbi:MAG: hypothetical protein COT74_09940 [Bdellovibrionales bacterium CG10_big_fil_rev_8_21_14_0_10_45_34]|nr:MAG: hypothetical protein COT74_09940 [Bdellovibrionales bacterium CG10_big_fil_rev_8_21_14_0_10_45_34]
MWSAKVLLGPDQGKAFALTEGVHTFGRGSDCSVVINSKGISKRHFQIKVSGSSLAIQDLGSSNGTFVNGVKIKSARLKLGDQIQIFDTILGISALLHAVEQPKRTHQIGSSTIPFGAPPNLEPNTQEAGSSQLNWDASSFSTKVNNWIEHYIMPAVYEISQKNDFKWVLAGFIGSLALLITVFSLAPMIQITKESVDKESGRRALSIAQMLAERYEIANRQGVANQFDTRRAEVEEGVEAAYIIKAIDGSTLAPARLAGEHINLPFVHTARRSDQKMMELIDSDRIGASVPIMAYSSEMGAYAPVAYSVIIYNKGSLAVDNGRVLALFVKVLMLSFILGAICFVLLYRVIKKPIKALKDQVHQSLSEKIDMVNEEFALDEFSDLVINIKAAIQKANLLTDSSDSLASATVDHSLEAENLSRLIAQPCMAISSDKKILAINQAFEDISGLRSLQLNQCEISQIPDQSLLLSLEELLGNATQNPTQVQSQTLDFNGIPYSLDVQAIQSNRGVEYYLVVATDSTGAQNVI